MNRHALQIIASLLVPAALASTGCASKQPTINHVVLIDLKDDSEQKALVADCDRLLPSIPEVASYWCGVHGDYGRSGVDSDYDVALCVGFVRDEDYVSYLIHPAHVELVTEWKPKFEWIRIHDVVDASH